MSQQASLKFSDLRATHRLARRQAKLKRVFSPCAFASTLEQPVRWHLFYDGTRVVSVVCAGTGKTRSWSEGPSLDVAELGQAEILQARVKQLLQQQKCAGLGVVLHLADQLDQGIVREEFENPELFEHANALVRENPTRVVTDLSDDLDPSIQWRYYPLLSGQRAVVLRHQLEFLSAFETLIDLDIKVAVHSAPIEMLALYLKLYEHATEEKPHFFVFFYDRFTVVAPVHHGVLDFKVLPHRQQDVPATFGDDLFSLLEKLGFVDSCVLLLIPCGTHEPTLLFHELDAYSRRNQKNADGIEIQIPDREALWSVLNEFAYGQLKGSVVQRPEFLSEYREWSDKEFSFSLGIQGDLQRFWILSRETFWPDNQESRERSLPKTLAFVMIGLRIGRIVGALLLVGLAGWFALFVATAYQGEALRALPDLIGGKKGEFERLNSAKQYLAKWDKILRPRSQTWSTMELVLGLLPEGKDILWEKLNYAIKQADSKPAVKNADAAPGGFSRQWIIDGLCNDQGRTELERLQETSTLTKLFDLTATRLEDPSFAVSGTRTVKADLREEANTQAGPATQGGSLPYKFRLVVTENVPANDPLALPALPKPKKAAM
ncbi:MAG TPA: hypothetical protein VFO40_21005 [Chthoniobacterales bacterium]|nr:hypothetical protein [Chthoniobacterales bacterium]